MLPRVSVCMITYNHEKYIAQAIESVLMQETDFAVELIIGEDCSTDGTRAIVEEYQRRYPDQINALCRERNLGPYRNSQDIRSRARGEFIASLEGDDYWTDPLKLQKQVAFMDSHPECSFSGHTVRIVNEYGQWDGVSRRPNRPVPEIADLETLLRLGYYIQTCSMLYRRERMGELPDWYAHIPSQDYARQVLLAGRGTVGFISEAMADYRIHPGGIFSQGVASSHTGMRLVSQIEHNIKSTTILRSVVPREYRPILTKRLARFYEQRADRLLDAGMPLRAALSRGRAAFEIGYRRTVHRGRTFLTKGRRRAAFEMGLAGIVLRPWRPEAWRLSASVAFGWVPAKRNA